MTDIANRWATIEQRAATGGSPSPARKKFRFYKPFVNAVDTYVREAQDGERIYFGIDEFDSQIRGVGRSQLCIINGYSHSGKTLFLAHVLDYNRDKRIAYFTPDEPAHLVLAKLAALRSGVPADEIESLVAQGDDAAIEMLRQTALRDFPLLAVFEQTVRGEEMYDALDEAELVWGAPAQAVVLDYLELLQAGDTVQAKGEFCKSFCTTRQVPFFLIHQTSRSAGAEGKRQTISSGAYGGETLATFQLGVWRKKSSIVAELEEVNDRIARAASGGSDAMLDRREQLRHELERHEYTVTVAVTKNKRPGRRTGREEIDFELYGDTGLLVPLAEGDVPQQFRAKLAAEQRLMVDEVGQAQDGWLQSEWVQSDDEFYQEEW